MEYLKIPFYLWHQRYYCFLSEDKVSLNTIAERIQQYDPQCICRVKDDEDMCCGYTDRPGQIRIQRMVVPEVNEGVFACTLWGSASFEEKINASLITDTLHFSVHSEHHMNSGLFGLCWFCNCINGMGHSILRHIPFYERFLFKTANDHFPSNLFSYFYME